MSEMLEKAIIDATALKEVAIKNAESQMIEKFSEQIKEAVNLLLEQDDEELPQDDLGTDALSMGGIEGEEFGQNSVAAGDVPFAATDGEKLCDCPDSEEEIEINFDDLSKQMMGDTEQSPVEQPIETHEELADELPVDTSLKQEGEELSLNEEQLNKIMEELEVDIEPVPTGWRGVPQSQREDVLDVALAQEQDTEIKKDNEKLRKEIEDIKTENKQLKESQEKMVSESKKQNILLNEMKSKMNSLVLNNAKLLYSNKVLGSNSLNGQQKLKLVESVQKAKSMEEAKVIYESLQNTMGFQKEKTQSLSEAIVKPSTVLISSRESKQEPANEMSEKWQKLAGIKK